MIQSQRPVFNKNGLKREEKEITYARILYDMRGFFPDNGESVRYCGLTSANLDRIYVSLYPYIRGMDCYENDKENMKGLVHIAELIKITPLADLMGTIKLHFANILDPSQYNEDDRFGIFDFDFNGNINEREPRQVADIVIGHSAVKSVVMIWNTVGRGITKNRHTEIVNSLDGILEKYFRVKSYSDEYTESSPMYCKYLLLERK